MLACNSQVRGPDKQGSIEHAVKVGAAAGQQHSRGGTPPYHAQEERPRGAAPQPCSMHHPCRRSAPGCCQTLICLVCLGTQRLLPSAMKDSQPRDTALQHLHLMVLSPAAIATISRSSGARQRSLPALQHQASISVTSGRKAATLLGSIHPVK